MRTRFFSGFFIQLFIAVFFIASAIAVLGGYNANQVVRGIGKLFGGISAMPTIVAVVELISGIILLAGLFIGARRKMLNLASYIIFILWLINVIMMYFFGGTFFKPNFIVWTSNLALHLVVAAGLLAIISATED